MGIKYLPSPRAKGNIDSRLEIGFICPVPLSRFLQSIIMSSKKKINRNLKIVEKNKLCGGTTQNTTAKITYSHGLIYDKLSKDPGVEGARLYFEANRSAFEKFAQMCKDIDCDYERKDNFVYSTDDRQKLESELSAAEKIGCNAKLCENVPLPIKTVGAVCFPSQAQFDPLKFL